MSLDVKTANQVIGNEWLILSINLIQLMNVAG